MNKQMLEEFIALGYSQRKIATACGVSQTTIKYHLQKFSLKTKGYRSEFRWIDGKQVSKNCWSCKTEKPIADFYERKAGFTSACKYCLSKNMVEKQRNFKRLCIDYKGGQCKICNYDRCQAALEFHHRDMSEKEFNISKYKMFKLTDQAKEELDKCDLLCAICHREIHNSQSFNGET